MYLITSGSAVNVAIAAQAEQMAARKTFQENLSKNNAQLVELRDDKYGVKSAVFSPAGRQILTTTAKTVRLWDTKSSLLAKLELPSSDGSPA